MPQQTPEQSRVPATKRDAAVAKRRRQILEAALMCFLENGYHQTGVRDIAKRAGVSLGNLYNHFPGKHDVLAEIAALERDELAPFLKLLAKPSAPAKLLDRFITTYAKYSADPENVILSFEIAGEALRKRDIADMFMDNRNTLVAALKALLQRGIGEQIFRSSLNPDDTAQMIIDVIEGAAYRSTLDKVPLRKILPGLKRFVFAAVLLDAA